jgi:uncharacterized membrane protein YfcA
MKEKVIVSAFTVACSLATYFYAKQTQKDAAPFMMIGGFLGAVIGETIAHSLKGKNNGTDKKA